MFFEEPTEELDIGNDYIIFVGVSVFVGHAFAVAPTPQDQLIVQLASIFFGLGCGFLKRCQTHFKFKRLREQKNLHRTLMFIRKQVRFPFYSSVKFIEAPLQYRIVPRAWWQRSYVVGLAVGQSEVILTEETLSPILDDEGTQHKHLRCYKGGKS